VLPPLGFAAGTGRHFPVRGVLHFHLRLFSRRVSTRWCSTCARRCSAVGAAAPTSFFDDQIRRALLSRVAYEWPAWRGGDQRADPVLVRDSAAVAGLLAG